MTTSSLELSFAGSEGAAAAGRDSLDRRWTGLYRAGGAAAALSAGLIAAAIAAHILWPPPDWSAGAAVHWFARFAENRLLGLIGLDLLIVVGLVLAVPIHLALYLVLRRAGASVMAVATALALVGTVLHLVSNTAFEMMALSQAYTAAATEAQRALFLAAGEAALAGYYGTVFHVSYILGYAAKLLISLVMLRSTVFGKGTACVGILAGAAGLLFYVPGIGMIFSILSVVLIAVWNVLIGRTLLQLRPSS